jgi:hypothetical protein
MKTWLVVAAVCAAFWVPATVAGQVRTGPFPPGQGRGVGGPVRAVPPERIGMMTIEPLDV